jgi:hypothetical protein
MCRLLIDVDSTLAREQYDILRRHFVVWQVGMPAVREYPHRVHGPGDVDSGPLVFGMAGPATIVGAGAARVNGDPALAAALDVVPEVTGFPLEIAGRRSYGFGLVPVGEALLAWARSGATAADRRYNPVIPTGWRLPIHAVSGVLALVVIAAFRRYGR